jgi:hypothetical protein
VQAPSETLITATDIYRVYFHGPAYQVMGRAWREGDRIIGEMKQNLPINHSPSELPTVAAPRFVELCFQTAGLWEMSVLDRFGLPKHFDQVRILCAPESVNGPLFAVVTPHGAEGTFDARIVDAKGKCYVELSGYRTVALPGGVGEGSLQMLQAVMA